MLSRRQRSLGKSRMDIHKNARLTPHGRERLAKMIVSGQTPQAASEAVGVCPRTGRKWADRFRQEGLAGLQDRNSRPHRLYRPTPQAVIDRIESLRRQRRPGKEIAAEAGVSPATVSRVLKKLGLNKLSALEPAAPARRYERDRPGEMIHIDIKKLGKFDQIGHRITGDQGSEQQPRRRLGVRPCLHRRRLACGLQPDQAGRAKAKCRGLPQGRCRLLRKLGYYRGARHDRQRLLLQIPCLQKHLPAAVPEAHSHKALHTTDQRQGRALHPNLAPRVGLRSGLPDLAATRPLAALLLAPLQLASSSCQCRRKATH